LTGLDTVTFWTVAATKTSCVIDGVGQDRERNHVGDAIIHV
jgi:hypothetical protein